MKLRLSPGAIRRVLNFWPPFLFSGVHVTQIADDWRSARVELRSRPWNRNYVGVHFGGNLFAMTDPFWMLLTMHALGRDYIVWDQAGAIEFLKPGRGVVRASFQLDDAVLAQLRHATANGAKDLHWFETDVVDASGEVVARVRKQLYVRRKRHGSAREAGPRLAA
jgi:acyl-coenzyme A thioesterase PaaI-like protein